jgi:hypothetical protein
MVVSFVQIKGTRRSGGVNNGPFSLSIHVSMGSDEQKGRLCLDGQYQSEGIVVGLSLRARMFPNRDHPWGRARIVPGLQEGWRQPLRCQKGMLKQGPVVARASVGHEMQMHVLMSTLSPASSRRLQRNKVNERPWFI